MDKKTLSSLDIKSYELVRVNDNFFHPVILPPNLPKASINKKFLTL
jgi:hypothetical protein